MPDFDILNVPRSGGDAHGDIAILYKENLYHKPSIVTYPVLKVVKSFFLLDPSV